MRVRKEFTIITIVDNQGNSWTGAVGDIERDLLQVSGLQLADGSNLSFRANVADIIERSTESDLRSYVTMHSIEIVLPG